MSASAGAWVDQENSRTVVLKTRRIAGRDIMLEPGHCYVALQSMPGGENGVTVEIFRIEQLASLNTEPAARLEGLTPDAAEQLIAGLNRQSELGVW